MPLVAECLSIIKWEGLFCRKSQQSQRREPIRKYRDKYKGEPLTSYKKSSNLSNLVVEFYIAMQKRRNGKALKRVINHKIPL